MLLFHPKHLITQEAKLQSNEDLAHQRRLKRLGGRIVITGDELRRSCRASGYEILESRHPADTVANHGKRAPARKTKVIPTPVRECTDVEIEDWQAEIFAARRLAAVAPVRQTPMMASIDARGGGWKPASMRC